MVLTEELGEPLRLVVVLDGDGARVEEDEEDDEPEPVGRLAAAPDEEPDPLLGVGHLLVLLRLPVV